MPVFAAELTEADVEAAVARQGKEAGTSGRRGFVVAATTMGTHGTGQAPSCNQKFSHHVSSGIADIDAKGGDFANQVISNIAQGNYGQVGSIKGADTTESLYFLYGHQSGRRFFL